MLCKCSGKYIDIYFILKITFLEKPNFYLLVFIYTIKFSNLATYLERVDKFY